MTAATLAHYVESLGLRIVRAAHVPYLGCTEIGVQLADGTYVPLRHYDRRYTGEAHFSALLDIDGDPVEVSAERQVGQRPGEFYRAQIAEVLGTTRQVAAQARRSA